MVWVVSQSLTWVEIVVGGPGQEEYQTGQEEYRTVSRAWPGIISNGAPMNDAWEGPALPAIVFLPPNPSLACSGGHGSGGLGGWVADADAVRCGGGCGQMQRRMWMRIPTLRKKSAAEKKWPPTDAQALLAAVATAAAAAAIAISGAGREVQLHQRAVT
jgi:hypothetical protein